MVPGNSRNDDNLPSPFEDSDGRRLTDKENEASQDSHAHINSSSKYTSCVSLLDSHGGNMYETVQSFTENPAICKNGTDYMSFGTLQNSHVLEDGLRIQDFCDMGYQNPQVNVNYIPTESTTRGFEMNAQERVANRNWFQTIPSSGALTFNSTNEVSPINDINIDAFNPSNIDGGFLALGLGGDLGCNREEKFNSREFPCTISPQYDRSYVLPGSNSYVLPANTNYSNPSQMLTQDFLGFQHSPMFNPNDWTSLYNDNKISETLNWDTLGLVQNPYPFQSPSNSAPNHYNFFGSSGFETNSVGINPTITVPPGYEGFPAPHSLPFNNFNANYDFASESAKPIWTAPPPTYQLQNSDDTKDRGISFSIPSHPTGQRGSSSTNDYLGLPPTQPTDFFSSHALGSIPPFLGVHFPDPTKTVKLNPAQGIRSSTSSDMFGLQIGRRHARKPVKAGLLPSRTGRIQLDNLDQFNQQTVKAGPLPSRTTGIQLDNLAQFNQQSVKAGPHPSRTAGIQLDNLAQFNQEIPGFRQAGLQAKNNVIKDNNGRVYSGPTSGSGVYLMPTGPGPSSVHVHNPPMTSSYVTSKSSLKRKAAEPLTKVPSSGRRKKYVRAQGVSAVVTSYAGHIKCSENVESTPQLVGWNCLLCKLDLSFEPDNPEHQPTVKPGVAVLPCGHTFHDHCLQLITTKEDAKDPPCIPCAMGEN